MIAYKNDGSAHGGAGGEAGNKKQRKSKSRRPRNKVNKIMNELYGMRTKSPIAYEFGQPETCYSPFNNDITASSIMQQTNASKIKKKKVKIVTKKHLMQLGSVEHESKGPEVEARTERMDNTPDRVGWQEQALQDSEVLDSQIKVEDMNNQSNKNVSSKGASKKKVKKDNIKEKKQTVDDPTTAEIAVNDQKTETDGNEKDLSQRKSRINSSKGSEKSQKSQKSLALPPEAFDRIDNKVDEKVIEADDATEEQKEQVEPPKDIDDILLE